MDADVVIMGGGFAGLVTGVRASELGLKAIVLEKGAEPDYPCNSRYSGGNLQVFQYNMSEEPEKLMAALQQRTAGFVSPDLGGAFVMDARRGLDWLRAQGTELTTKDSGDMGRWVMSPPRSGAPGLDWEGRGPDALLHRLTAALTAKGGKILLDARIEDAVVESGTIVGVEANVAGKRQRISASAVVIADGGFQSDPDLLRKYITRAPERLFQRNARNGTGDGLRLAERLGAKLVGMEWFYGHPLSRDAFYNEKLWPHPYLDAMCVSGIVVDGMGHRFVDEGMGPWFICNALARSDDPLDAIAIFDETIWTGPAASLRSPPPANPTFRDAGGTLHVGATVAALAGVAGLPADALMQSVSSYNKALQEENLASLSPPRSQTRGKAYPILTPPFYAAPICAGITYTMGGPAIDTDCRVLHRDDHPITNLFAVGSAAGGLEGGSPVGYFGGIAKAITSGLRAAEYIARRN